VDLVAAVIADEQSLDVVQQAKVGRFRTSQLRCSRRSGGGLARSAVEPRLDRGSTASSRYRLGTNRFVDGELLDVGRALHLDA